MKKDHKIQYVGLGVVQVSGVKGAFGPGNEKDCNADVAIEMWYAARADYLRGHTPQFKSFGPDGKEWSPASAAPPWIMVAADIPKPKPEPKSKPEKPGPKKEEKPKDKKDEK